MKPRTVDGVEQELREAWARNDQEAAAALERELDALDSPARPVPVLGAALWYAQHGLHVFPIQPRAKVPYPHSRGCKDATTDADRITAWFSTRPDANLGIATGHRIDVIDFDGLAAHQSWPFPDWGGVQVLGTVCTPRPGGLHLYVPATGDGNRAAIYPGVDYRGRGGYVLAPPSTTDVGTYRFLRPLHLEQP